MPIRFILRFALALAVIITAASCGKDHVSPDSYRIDSLNMKFLVGSSMGLTPITGGTVIIDPASRPMVYFSYKDNKVQLRFGGWMDIPTAGGFKQMYTLDLYDSVAYNGNHITIIPRGKNGFSSSTAPQRDIWLDGSRIKKVITTINNYPNDTSDYYYNISRISKVITHNGLRTITRTFTFNNQGNLEKVNANNNDQVFSEETFEGYDNTPNLLKGVGIWEDLYYRSLSTNNFTSYSRKTTGPGASYSTFNMNINLEHQSNGYVDYSK